MTLAPGVFAIRLASSLESHSPRFANWIKRWYANYLVPFNRMSGIRVVDAGNDLTRAAVQLKNIRGNQNAVGTVHGGAILALAETVHGVAVLWRFTPDRHRMFTKSARIDYLAPGRGKLYVEYRLSDELSTRIETDLSDRNRSEISMQSVVTDSRGKSIANLVATYVVLRVAL